jgi:arabinosaccharide transport system permease protein
MSFQNIKPTGIEWIGIKNYTKLLSDKVFHTAVLNSFEYMLLSLVLLVPFPMLYAVLMDSRLVKAKGLWKALLYLPALTSVVISGTLFRLMFSEYHTGQMNVLMQTFGFATQKWLKVKATGLGALIVLCCWRWTGVNMLYFLSGLKSIDGSLYEAAQVDGATRMQVIRHITIPSLLPTYFVLLMLSIASFLNNGMEQYFVFQNAFNKNTIQVLDLYGYNLAMGGGSYSIATAISMLKSLVSIILLFSVNGLSKLIRGESIV